jgi:integrase/recombinase XerD
MVAAIRGFYAWSKREGVINLDPATLLEYPRAGARVPIAVSLSTAESLLMAPDIETLKGVRDAAIIAFLIGSGMRIAGLCRLNQRHLVWTSDTDKRERLVLRVVEKGNKERLIPMTTEAMLYIRAYLHHPDLAAIDRTLPDGDQVLFASLRNRTIPPHEYHGERRRIAEKSIDDMIKWYGRKLRLPEAELHAHAFRHLYGTELAESDIDLTKRMALMGHADANTSAIYDHTAMRKLSSIVDLANPLRKIRTPVTELARHIERGKA